jgi:hypothetical protein
VHTGFWWGNLRASDHMEDPGIDGRIILRWITSKRKEMFTSSSVNSLLLNAVTHLKKQDSDITL